MKPGKLYFKIFFSFLLVLIVTEILVFALFLFSSGRIFRSRLERHARAQVLLLREFIEDKITSEPETLPAENESLRHLISRLAKNHGSKIWLTDTKGGLLIKSFPGRIPNDLARISDRRAKDLGDFKMYSSFKKGHFFYIVIPTEIGKGKVGNLHILSEKIEKDYHEWAFALGLAGIGIAIALLIIPVSRLITQPLKRLRESALQIAGGNLSFRATVKSRDEIGELSRAFNSMADKLERMIRGGRELTANISHELRSPLARIRVAQELLRERLEQGKYDECRRHLDGIGEDVEELDHLIDRILALSKLDINEESFKRESFNPADLMNELLERFKPAIRQRSLHLVTDLPVERTYFGDREALRTALSNILDNAVKFTAEKGKIIVRTSSENGSLRISVTSSFEVLPGDDLARIFEPFYRTEQPQGRGSGLGLAITKRIIEKHGGTIEASNSPEGLKIEIDLPAA